MINNARDRIMSLEQVAKIFGVTPQAFRTSAKEKKEPFTIVWSGNHGYIAVAEIEKFLNGELNVPMSQIGTEKEVSDN